MTPPSGVLDNSYRTLDIDRPTMRIAFGLPRHSTNLSNGVMGNVPPNYDDSYIAAAYMVEYHLNVIALWLTGLSVDFSMA